jgi:sodium transport system permease protein
MFTTMARQQRQVEDVTLAVVGGQHAPALMSWLQQQAGVTVTDGPANPEEAVRTRTQDIVVVIADDFAKAFNASRPAQVRIVADGSRQDMRARLNRVRGLFQQYNNQIGSLRLIARGISPAVASPLQIEDVEVSSAQQRAAMVLGIIPLFLMIAATDSTAGERERGSIEALLVNPAPRGAIAAGKWAAGTVTAIASVFLSAVLLFALFQYIPLQDLGLRFRLGWNELLGMLIIVLPLCPFIVALQMYVATYAKSFKEAQAYLSYLMMAQMIPGMMVTMNTTMMKAAWLYYVPWVGAQTLLTDVIGNKPINPLIPVVVGALHVAIAVAAINATARLLHREKIIFGR